MHKLTTAQCQIVCALVAGDRSHDSIKNPACWHQVVLHWNWDDGVEGIAWWCQHKKCDLGTALTAYWLASPEFYAPFATREAAATAGCEMAVFDLVRDIEQRVKDGFYKNQKIGYDPGSGFEDVARLSVPDLMKAKAPGEPFPLFELQRVCIRPLREKDTKSLERKRKQAAKLLAEVSIEQLSPTEVVAVLAVAAAGLRDDAKDRAAKRKIEPLGWLWYDQVVAEFGWEILAWDWETGATVMVFSPDRKWCINAVHMVQFGPLHELADDYVERLFAGLADLEQFDERIHYLGCGILKTCEHLPYRDSV